MGNEHSINSNETSLTVPDEVTALIAQANTLNTAIEENQKVLTKKSEHILCPICQDGYLYISERGKILGIFADKWLICRKCGAEFDKRFSKATLISAKMDPYDVLKNFKDRRLSMEEWKAVIQKRIQAENDNKEAEVSAIKGKLGQYLFQQFLENKFQFMPIDLNCFLLKKDEVPVFGTKAEVIEERKRKITQRTSTGGGRRNYGGFSFRVAKGVYFHTGSSAPAGPRQTSVQSTEYTELVTADSGDFLITNQRILFVGNKSKGLAIPIKKVAAIHIDPDENALMIMQENKKPYILKLQTKFTAKFSGLEIPLSINLDQVVNLIKAE